MSLFQSLLENDLQKLTKVRKELTEAEKLELKELKKSQTTTFRYKEVLIAPLNPALVIVVDVLILGRYG